MYLRVFREKLDANIRLVCTSNVQKFIANGARHCS
ncbi:hypothetical protein [Anoxybacillus flavithermus]